MSECEGTVTPLDAAFVKNILSFHSTDTEDEVVLVYKIMYTNTPRKVEVLHVDSFSAIISITTYLWLFMATFECTDNRAKFYIFHDPVYF